MRFSASESKCLFDAVNFVYRKDNMAKENENRNVKTMRFRLGRRRLLLLGVFVLLLVVTAYVVSQLSTAPATNYTAIFDFDTGYPLLHETQNTPLNQTVNGITAYFSSPSETLVTPAFSIQSYDTTFTKLSQFSGKYLYDNKPSRDILEILFSEQLSRIEITFATVEHHVEPSNISLTAYETSTNVSPIGSSLAKGEYRTGLFPQGKLSFDSGGKPFNLVRIEVPYQGRDSPTNFYLDNVKVLALSRE